MKHNLFSYFRDAPHRNRLLVLFAAQTSFQPMAGFLDAKILGIGVQTDGAIAVREDGVAGQIVVIGVGGVFGGDVRKKCTDYRTKRDLWRFQYALQCTGTYEF